MNLTEYIPIKEAEEITDYLNEYFNDFPFFEVGESNIYSLRTDIYEKDNHIFVETEIPGMNKKNIKVKLENNVLTITGEKKRDKEDKETIYRHNERIFGTFERSFTLPVEVNPEKTEAKFENGVLVIKLQKLEKMSEEEKIIQLK